MDYYIKELFDYAEKHTVLSAFKDEILLLNPDYDEWILKLSEKASIMIAYNNNDVCGLLAYYIASEYIYITLLVISPKYRSMGIASSLMRQVIEVSSNDRKPIRLEVATTNHTAIALYLKHGFSRLGDARIGSHYYERIYFREDPT